MSCSPAELNKKCETFASTWRAYIAAPTFDHFVEFAVTLSSFAEFLFNRGLSGLHHVARDLELQALALFGSEDSHPIATAAMNELDARALALIARVNGYIESASRPIEERRASEEQDTAADLSPGRRVWFVAQRPEVWSGLTDQLGFFGIDARTHLWDAVPEEEGVPTTLLLDVAGMPLSEWSVRIRELRQRFVASNLLCLSITPEFISLQTALASGCDICIPDGTPLPLVIAKVLELNDSQEEEPYRVLVVEDSLTAAKLIQRTLDENGVQSMAISKPRDALEALKRYQPDLVLMDMYMPECTGVEAARVIRQQPEFLSLPIVYLSGETDVGLQIEALRLGGDHFLTKPFNPVILNAIVQSKIERYRAVRRSIFHDSLTGLLNHTTTKQRLDTAVGAAESDGNEISVAMIDIDHFKKVNDTYGHPVGDQVMRSLAWLLKQRLRKGDIVGRYGGEEFLVGLPDTGAERAFEVVDRIRRDFSQIKHPFNETWFNTSFSSGIATFPRVQGAESMVKAADESLYDAKRGGRNQVRVLGLN